MSPNELPAREAMEFDVVIVGAGPAGLSTAIRLKQLAPQCSVVIVEKGSEVGAHILSGAVIDPIGLDRLLPDWRNDSSHPLRQAVMTDRFYWLTKRRAVRLPNWLMPPLMSNHGNFVASLGDVCRWLAKKAESLGVELYPGFAATEVLYGSRGEVLGVVTGDMGVGKDGQPKPGFTRGIELRAKYTLFAEGARGSLTKALIEKYSLQEDHDAPKFCIGLRALAGATRAAPRWAHTTHLRLAARQSHRRRLVSLPLGRQSGLRGIRGSPQLSQPMDQPVRGAAALQDPSSGSLDARRRQTDQLRRARHNRGGLAVSAEAHPSRRNSHRVRRRLR